MYELVVRGGTVIDGTGTPGVTADIAITDGRIAAIGQNLAGERVLDATGCVVAPGFIDIHTHYDAQVFWDPSFTPSCFHGVTTVVAGNCGFSLAPARADHHDLIARTFERVEDMNLATLQEGVVWNFSTFPEYLASVESRGITLNFASYIGHTALRLFTMGAEAYDREATADEIEAMKLVLADAIEAGAAGFTTSHATPHRGADNKPVPSRLSSRSELEELLEVMREGGRGVVTVAVGDKCPVEDLYELQPKVGLPFTYVALLAEPEGSHRKLVELHHEAWSKGIEVYPQVSPRPITFEFSLAAPFNLSSNEAFAELGTYSLEQRRVAYADPEWRTRASKGFTGKGLLDFTPRWHTYEISEAKANPSLNGRRLVAVAEERGVTPLEAMIDLALAESDLALRIKAVLLNDDPHEVEFLLSQENCVLGLSDAGAHVNALCDAPQATELLGTWVRERGVMSIETAVRRLSGIQADLFGFADRGYLKTGYAADVVVFDPDTVAPGPVRRLYDFPGNAERLTAPEPVGMRHVIVNGTPIHVDGVHDEAAAAARPGQLVRPSARTDPAA